MRPSRNRPHAELLADAFLRADAWKMRKLVAAGARVFAVPLETEWLKKAATRAIRSFAEAPRGERRVLVARIERNLGRVSAAKVSDSSLFLEMGPTPFAVPALPTTGDLARWLEITVDKLAWFADPRALERRVQDERLRHYRYQWVAKKSGGVRLLEAPKPHIKAIARKLLHSLLDCVPPHDAAHGFRPGRSVVTHAALHTGAAMVVRMDLRDFFLSIRAARVRALFAKLGYPSEVAWMLTCVSSRRSFATKDLPFIPRRPAFLRRSAQQKVTGVVVNERVAIARRERKRLEAILYNCLNDGAASQNRDGHPDFRAHLRGRIAHVRAVDPAHAEKLAALFARIPPAAWQGSGRS